MKGQESEARSQEGSLRVGDWLGFRSHTELRCDRGRWVGANDHSPLANLMGSDRCANWDHFAACALSKYLARRANGASLRNRP